MQPLNENLTPMRVLFNILVRYGYVDSPSAFAELLRLNKGNVAAYLADREADNRIVPRIDTLHVWSWGVSATTDLKLQLLLVGKDLFWYCTGFTSDGHAVPARDKWPTSHSMDFSPLKAWRDTGDV